MSVMRWLRREAESFNSMLWDIPVTQLTHLGGERICHEVDMPVTPEILRANKEIRAVAVRDGSTVR
jgi:hypothetical protein